MIQVRIAYICYKTGIANYELFLGIRVRSMGKPTVRKRNTERMKQYRILSPIDPYLIRRRVCQCMKRKGHALWTVHVSYSPSRVSFSLCSSVYSDGTQISTSPFDPTPPLWVVGLGRFVTDEKEGSSPACPLKVLMPFEVRGAIV
jgi:hypothetical protein